MSEDFWIERAQSAEAKIGTMQQTYGAAIDRIQQFKTNFGIREKHNGEIEIDFQKFVERLGPEQSSELRNIITEKYGLNG